MGSSFFTSVRGTRSARLALFGTGPAGELSAARDPRQSLGEAAASALAPARKVVDLDSWWDRFIESRLDTADGTRANYRKAKDRFSSLLGDRDPSALTLADVQEAVSRLSAEIQPATLHKYVNTLRQVLDFADVEPNVARDRRVRLPRVVHDEPEPPDAPQVESMLHQLTARWLLGFITADQTGMRVGEIASICWRDVDVAGSRFRVRGREEVGQAEVGSGAGVADERDRGFVSC